MAYKFKKVDYRQINDHYRCVVPLYLPKDIKDDVFDLYKMGDDMDIKFLRENIENDVLDDFKNFLKQNMIEFDISESEQMDFMLYFDCFDQLNNYIVWEMPINDKNTQSLAALEELLAEDYKIEENVNINGQNFKFFLVVNMILNHLENLIVLVLIVST